MTRTKTKSYGKFPIPEIKYTDENGLNLYYAFIFMHFVQSESFKPTWNC